MKRCTKCDTEKQEDAFEMQPSRGRLRAECRECRRKGRKEWIAKREANAIQQEIETKRCKHCHEVKSISEFSPASGGYFHVECKTCTNAEKKAEYDANPEKYRERVRTYAHKYPERVQARYQRWHEAHKEQRIEYYRQHHKSHRDKRNAQAKAYRTLHHEQYLNHYRQHHKRHREERNALCRVWHANNQEHERLYRKAHPHEFARYYSDRRARRRNAPIIEKIDRKAVIERDNWTCYLCLQICTSQNVTLDHVVPLLRGGTHTVDNLRVACRSCNSSKGAKHLHEFLK